MCARTSDSRSSPPQPPSAGAPRDRPDAERDAQAELAQLAGELRRATLDLVWRQWRTVGAGAAARAAGGRAAAAAGPGAERTTRDGASSLHTLVDPEALVLISLALLNEERRLGDLLHDWVARNSDLLSVQRIKNLADGYAAPARAALVPQLAWFAAVARDAGKDLRWRSVAQTWADARDRSGGGVAPTAWADDHRRAGSGQTVEKVRATRARLSAPSSLLLRLRLGFGVGVKADLLAFLLAQPTDGATVRDLVGATAYTAAAVRRAADDLAAARLVETRDGQPARYRAAYAAWGPLLGLDDRPRWGSWHERFAFTAAFLCWAATARGRPLSPYALGAGGRDLLEQYRPAFEHDAVAVWSAYSPIADWGAFLRQSVHALVAWMENEA